MHTFTEDLFEIYPTEHFMGHAASKNPTIATKKAFENANLHVCDTSTFVINYDTHKLTKCYVSWPLHFNSYEIIKKRTFSCKIYTAKV